MTSIRSLLHFDPSKALSGDREITASLQRDLHDVWRRTYEEVQHVRSMHAGERDGVGNIVAKKTPYESSARLATWSTRETAVRASYRCDAWE